MFADRTTIVVGAGASCEYGLPSGDTLKEKIISRVKPSSDHIYGIDDAKFTEDIRHFSARNGTDVRIFGSALRDAAKAITTGLRWSPSIDNFLFTHQDNALLVRLGKAAIANTILSAEANSDFISNKHRGQATISLASEKLQNSWLAPFARLLLSQTTLQTVKSSLYRVSFVIFNYDRCIEQFMHLVIQAHFNCTADIASEVLSDVEFLHPYGHLGCLPWQERPREETLNFGAVNQHFNGFDVGERLRTFTESIESDAQSLIQEKNGIS